MKPRPLTLHTWEVHAILEGRLSRITRPTPLFTFAPGDELWGRETWGVGTRPDHRDGWIDGIEYKADLAFLVDDIELLPLYRFEDFEIPDSVTEWPDGSGWRSPVTMPRWASRITLHVKDVRVCRVQEINDAVARAHGIQDGGCGSCGESEPCGCPAPQPMPRDAFIHKWHQSYPATRPWHSNPWVATATVECEVKR